MSKKMTCDGNSINLPAEVLKKMNLSNYCLHCFANTFKDKETIFHKYLDISQLTRIKDNDNALEKQLFVGICLFLNVRCTLSK